MSNADSTKPAPPPYRRPESADPYKAPPAQGLASLKRRQLRRPSLAVLLGQAFRDYVGKDVQQSTTYSYVWSADQSGHFMLGFVPTFLIGWFFSVLDRWCGITTWYIGKYGLLHAALTVMIAWTALELYDLYDSLDKIRRSTGYFRANTLNLIWNIVTALFYFGLGAVIAGSSAFGAEYSLGLFAVLFAIQLPVAIWWLRSKIIFQQAGLPYLYRLPNYDGVFNVGLPADTPKDQQKAAATPIVEFIERMIAPPKDLMKTEIEEPNPRLHMIVSGPQSSGKTSLGVGIGTEFAFNNGIGRYVTMSFLAQIVGAQAAAAIELKAAKVEGLERAVIPKPVIGSLPSGRGRSAAPNDNEFDDGRILWKWASVDLLIIDDVVELLLPVRRSLEKRFRDDGFRDEIEHEILTHHPKLLEWLGGPEKAKAILDETVGEIQSRLRVLASPEVVARYVAESFASVIHTLRQIPRIVWVLGDMILPNLFEDFVRKEFDFSGGSTHNLMTLELLPPPPANGMANGAEKESKL